MKMKKIYGLVLIGGKSRRMRAEKWRMEYAGCSQARQGYELLAEFCSKVFLSKRPEQVLGKAEGDFPCIVDRAEYRGIGPLGGILSAMKKYPQAAWLVLACDLPFVTPRTIRELMRKRNPRKPATAYIDLSNRLPEPLCAIYEAMSRKHLLRFFRAGMVCPREILQNCGAELVPPKEKFALQNINTPREYRAARRRFRLPRPEKARAR